MFKANEDQVARNYMILSWRDLSVEAPAEIVEEVVIEVIDGIEKYLIQNRVKYPPQQSWGDEHILIRCVKKLTNLFRPDL